MDKAWELWAFIYNSTSYFVRVRNLQSMIQSLMNKFEKPLVFSFKIKSKWREIIGTLGYTIIFLLIL